MYYKLNVKKEVELYLQDRGYNSDSQQVSLL